MKKLCGWLGIMFAISNIISHIIITSIYYESFQPTFMNFRNNNMTFLRTKNLWEKKIIKRQTTINYDVLQEDQDENNNDVSDEIVLQKLRFYKKYK